MPDVGMGSGRHPPPRSTLSSIPRPKRYHRPRGTKALPDGVVWAGRGSLWANPFFGRQWGHAKGVILHRRWLNGEIAALSLERLGFCPAEVDALARLRARVFANLWRISGRGLACSCPLTSRWCHVDTVLDLASSRASHMGLAA
jgi:hypothetical protein